MKKLLLATGFIAAAFPALAGPTETITGCATTPVDGSNYSVRVDPWCALSTDQNDGSSILKATAALALADLLTPDDEEAAE